MLKWNYNLRSENTIDILESGKVVRICIMCKKNPQIIIDVNIT